MVHYRVKTKLWSIRYYNLFFLEKANFLMCFVYFSFQLREKMQNFGEIVPTSSLRLSLLFLQSSKGNFNTKSQKSNVRRGREETKTGNEQTEGLRGERHAWIDSTIRAGKPKNIIQEVSMLYRIHFLFTNKHFFLRFSAEDQSEGNKALKLPRRRFQWTDETKLVFCIFVMLLIYFDSPLVEL